MNYGLEGGRKSTMIRGRVEAGHPEIRVAERLAHCQSPLLGSAVDLLKDIRSLTSDRRRDAGGPVPCTNCFRAHPAPELP
jgi:hypothetical protein